MCVDEGNMADKIKAGDSRERVLEEGWTKFRHNARACMRLRMQTDLEIKIGWVVEGI